MSPNAYAILGLLEARPWSAYELAQHMKTSSNLRQIWPRAESKIYQAPKDLEAAGWVTSTVEHTGRRSRTVYQITDEGRSALRHWLDEPAPLPHLEYEAALKVTYATAGTVDQLNETLQRIERTRSAALAQFAVSLHAILEEGFAIPERAHTSALVAGLVARLNRAMGEWNSWALEVVAEWDDITIDDHKTDWAEQTYRELLHALEDHLHRDARDNEEGTVRSTGGSTLPHTSD